MVSRVELATVRETLAIIGLPNAGTPFFVMVQSFTFVAFQDMVVAPLPELSFTTRLGSALIETFGARTVTVAMAGAEVPVGPVHVIEYDEVVDGVTKTPMAFDVTLPVEKPPDEVQDVAFVELHVSFEDSPWSIMIGFAERKAVADRRVGMRRLYRVPG